KRRIADRDPAPVQRAADAAPRVRRDVARVPVAVPDTPLLRCLQPGARERVRRAPLDGRGERDEIVARLAFVPGIADPGAVRARGGAVERAHTRDGWAPARQRAGLVEREDSRARELVEPGAAAHELAEIREPRQR